MITPKNQLKNLDVKVQYDQLADESVPVEVNIPSGAGEDSSPEKEVKELTPRKKLKKNSIVPLAFIIANILYIHCDQICPSDDPATCAKTFIFPNLTKWAILLFIAAIIFITVIYQGLKREISRLYVAAAILNILYLSLCYHPVLNTREYGQMFGYFFLFCVFLCIFIWGIFTSMRHCYKNCFFVLVSIPVVLIVLCLAFYFGKVKYSCTEWTHGIGGDALTNYEGLCEIKTPKVCAYEITDGWFDIARFKGCSKFKVKPNLMQKYYPDSPVVGFPRTESFQNEMRIAEEMQTRILERTVPLSSMNDPAAADLEVFIDKTPATGPEMLIKVKRNETLVNERNQIQHEGLVKNVLVIYIDALSRVNAMRKLKKTMDWFDQYTNNKDPKADAFQFFRYHSIAPYTWPNLHEALYGYHPDDPVLETKRPYSSYLQSYKDNGYITGHAHDMCQPTPLHVHLEDPIVDTPYDHELFSYSCDPHYHDPVSPFGIFKGPYASTRRCLYGKDVYEYAFDYADQFWRTYKDEKKIFYLDLLDAHEGTGELVKYMDDTLFNFLDNLKTDGLLEDTAVILYADHGLHMQGLFYLMDINEVFTEISLPAFYSVFPKSVTEKYGADIKANQQRLVSSHQVHHLFKSLAEGEKSESIKSSVLTELPIQRTCEDIGILDAKCVCTY